MSKFKVGDKVRCIEADMDEGITRSVGYETTVTDACEGGPWDGRVFKVGSFIAYDHRWELVNLRPDPLDYLKTTIRSIVPVRNDQDSTKLQLLTKMAKEVYGLNVVFVPASVDFQPIT